MVDTSKLAVFIVRPEWVVYIISNGICVKPSHGLKNLKPVCVGINRNDNNSLVMVVESDSVPEYLAYMRIMGAPVNTLNAEMTIDGVKMTDIPVIDPSYQLNNCVEDK